MRWEYVRIYIRRRFTVIFRKKKKPCPQKGVKIGEGIWTGGSRWEKLYQVGAGEKTHTRWEQTRKYIPGGSRWENIYQVGAGEEIYTRWEQVRKYIPGGRIWENSYQVRAGEKIHTRWEQVRTVWREETTLPSVSKEEQCCCWIPFSKEPVSKTHFKKYKLYKILETDLKCTSNMCM